MRNNTIFVNFSFLSTLKIFLSLHSLGFKLPKDRDCVLFTIVSQYLAHSKCHKYLFIERQYSKKGGWAGRMYSFSSLSHCLYHNSFLKGNFSFPNHTPSKPIFTCPFSPRRLPTKASSFLTFLPLYYYSFCSLYHLLWHLII